MRAGLNSFKPSSKIQIKNHLNSIKHQYLPDFAKKTADNMSFVSRRVWLEAFALAGARSMDEAKAEILSVLGSMDASYHEHYTRGLSKALMSTT